MGWDTDDYLFWIFKFEGELSFLLPYSNEELYGPYAISLTWFEEIHWEFLFVFIICSSGPTLWFLLSIARNYGGITFLDWCTKNRQFRLFFPFKNVMPNIVLSTNFEIFECCAWLLSLMGLISTLIISRCISNRLAIYEVSIFLSRNCFQLDGMLT